MAESKPKYKVGQKVTIKKLDIRDRYAHRFSINPHMVPLSGATVTIVEVCNTLADPGVIPNDGYKYHVAENDWSWASSMFEESGEYDTTISFHKKKRLKFNFSL